MVIIFLTGIKSVDTNFKISAGDTAWSSLIFEEYEGGADKPVNAFTNPGFTTEVYGGTPASPAGLSADKRIFSINATAANDTSGTLPSLANLRLIGTTTETQTTSQRGSQWEMYTTPQGATSPQLSLRITDGNKLQLGNSTYENGDAYLAASNGNLKLQSPLDTNGNNIINSGGDVTVDDNLKVNSTLTVDGTANLNGNVNLGNANTDAITATGYLKASNGFGLTVLNTATANYLSGVLGIISTGDVAYISDGDSGNPCIGVYNGSSWKRIALGSDISSS